MARDTVSDDSEDAGPASDEQPALTAERAAAVAVERLVRLTSKDVQGVTSVEPIEDGWLVEIETLEDRRIPSSADILAPMQAWMDWVGRVGHAIVDLGSPLVPASPGAEPGIGGFSIMQADNAEALHELMRGHPHTEQGGTIECFEYLTVNKL
ncbi:gas vesicle protein GvpO [Nocardia stercoris]|uniref:YCII-related domain-containing protein n=1 Tax=Nocardia stercoris TaxID=2483361 RepID=A0A3M2L1L2_9NOCA|nr:gas vesicle protein GvpO [Nocardia stercoris]RMI31461.1 hypothetical protein EBN03_19170 [Nocardia stercoris]